ncbi:MAG: hypothetical protein ICV67_02645 [Thermoleophilia bacterium]|nr:hypothetical protein [Thermoleophilia bacterium]
MATSRESRARLERAKARLDRLDAYPRPVRLDGVRVLTVPWLFWLPYLRRFQGYALWKTILLRRPLAETSDDLLTHELCHVWQAQHRRWHQLWAWATTTYERNPYEVEARRAVAATRN